MKRGSQGPGVWRRLLARWLPAVPGGLILAGFHVNAEPLVNVALAKTVTASAATWGGLVASSLTDGDPGTFAHPLASSGTLNYYFQIDLGRVYRLDHLLLRNRADGCCPERLSNYRVQLYADNGGVPGGLNWSADIRTNGTHSGVAGIDTISVTNSATGSFAGRFVRIVNLSNTPYNPQIAEVEVYGTLGPTIREFSVDDDTLSAGQATTLRWQILNATSASITPGIGSVPATSGSISLAPIATSIYTLVASDETAAATATVQVGVDVVLAPPLITEFMADNAGGLADEDGASSDWIELKNPNPYQLELGGYFLTDSPTNLTKWRCPDARIAPNGYRIVFASDKDRSDPLAELHANFKLAAGGDYLALVDRDGSNVLQQFPADYPASSRFARQTENVSYGSGSNGQTGYMRPPTPGVTNGPAFEGVVADPVFSVERGFYEAAFPLTITSATPGATIRYTLNGAEPTATSGLVLNLPIRITNTTVVRAAAFRSNWASTAASTHTYVFLSNVIASPLMNTAITRHAVYGPQMRQALLEVPSVSLVTGNAPNDTTEVRASIEWLLPDGTPGFQENCGVIQFGGAFTQFAKESWRLHFRSTYGAGRLKYPLFDGHAHGLEPASSFDSLELRSGSHDMAMRGFYMANPFTDDTLLEMGQLNPHGRFAHVYLNGVYWGLYHVRERWGAGMHRDYLGGAEQNYESINGNWNVGGWADPGTPYDGDGSAWAHIKSLRNNYQAVKPYLDVPQYIDYMLTYMFGGCESEYRCVGPTVPGSGFKFYLNDADGWFCGPWYCAADDRTGRDAPGRRDGDGPGSLFSMLFAEGHPDYRTLLADRIHQAMFQSGPLTPSRNAARLLERCAQIQRAFYSESARWSYLSPAEWASRRDHVVSNWLPTRTAQALAQWRAAGFYPTLDAPTLNQAGGSVAINFQATFTGPATGAIYYTTNGTDPRLPGGAVSSDALLARPTNAAARPLPPLVRSALWKCRTRNATQWSALNVVFFQVGSSALDPGEVRVSELNFNPPGSDATEFIELINVSDRAVNLRGAQFTNGITYRFPDNRDAPLASGQRLVLVNDLFAFQQRYGLEVPVAGVYSGNLDNGGERLSLVNASNNLISSFRYDGAHPWPVDADGGGYTLVLAHPELGDTNAIAWRVSAVRGGTPGGTDATVFPSDPNLDADGDTFPVLVEYALGTSDADASSGPDAVRTGVDDFGRFIVTLSRNLRADDVRVWVEVSPDLVSWFPAALFSTRVNSNGTATEIWGVAAAGQNILFLRVRVWRTSP